MSNNNRIHYGQMSHQDIGTVSTHRSRRVHVDENDKNDLDNSITTYARMCKSNDNLTVRQIIDGLRLKYDSNVIARNSCVSINTIDKTRTLYNHVGGDTMIQIADKLCSDKPSMKGGLGSPKPQGGKKKTVEEHLDTFNKGVDSANKAIESAGKAADLTIATANALAGLFKSAKEKLGDHPQTDQQQHQGAKKTQAKKRPTVSSMIVDVDEQEQVDEDDVSADPSSKEEVLKNIVFLQEQIASKDEQLLAKDAIIAKKTKELVDANYKFQTANAKAMALEAKLKQTAIAHAKKLEEFQQTHGLQIKKVAADVAAGKDLECGKKILALKQAV